jgi:small-conductance mechanosensitive channel
VDGETETFLNWLDGFGERNNIKFTVTISADPASATEGMQRFL